MRVKEKTEKLGSLIKKVDEQISLFVRLSAADENGTISCVCCGERVYYKDSDCAHFHDRDNMATRFYLPNLGAASRECNRFDHYNHIQRWTLRLSDETLKDLHERSHSFMKADRYELGQLLIEYTEKVKQIKKLKGL